MAQVPAADDLNPGLEGAAFALALQADGRLLVGGNINVAALGGQPHYYLGRLHFDGRLDTTSDSGVSVYSLFCVGVQPDGKILVGGSFTTWGGQTRNRIARLNTNGSLDTTFNPDASSTVYCMTFQPDGKLLVGGGFATLRGPGLRPHRPDQPEWDPRQHVQPCSRQVGLLPRVAT
jgi:uncharacterized delta-60 repeat protein